MLGPERSTMDRAGRRLFVDEFRPGGRLMELDPSGRGEPDILMEDLNGPNALAMGPDGRLYFPQVFANEIWVYDLVTRRGELLVDGLDVPTAVKFDSRGRIVTSEAGAGRIGAYNECSFAIPRTRPFLPERGVCEMSIMPASPGFEARTPGAGKRRRSSG